MLRLLRLVGVVADGGKVRRVGGGEGLLEGIVPRFLVAFGRNDIVGVTLDDRLGRPRLAMEGIHGDDTAGERQFRQECGHRRDFMRLRVDRVLAQDEPVGARPGADHLDGRLAPRLVRRFPQALAVHRHQFALGGRVDGGEPGHKALLQLDRFEMGQHAREGVVRGDAVGQGQDGAQPVFFGLAKRDHAGWPVRAAQDRAYRDGQDVQPHVVFCPVDAWVSQVAKIGCDARQESFCYALPPQDAAIPLRRIPV